MTGIPSPYSLADFTNNVGLVIWAAIGVIGLLAGFVSVNVAKRRSLKSMQSSATENEGGSQGGELSPVAATSSVAESASAPAPAQDSSSDYSAAFTASSSGRRSKRAHLTHAG